MVHSYASLIIIATHTKTQTLTLIFRISCKDTIPWRWHCTANAGSCSRWCFLDMDVQVIKLENSLKTIQVGCLLSSQSFLFEFEVFSALLPPSQKGWSPLLLILCIFSSCQSFFLCIWQDVLLICSPLCLSCLLATFCVSYMQLHSLFAPVVGRPFTYLCAITMLWSAHTSCWLHYFTICIFRFKVS